MSNPRKDQPFVCPTCHVIFGSGLALARHLQSHQVIQCLLPVPKYSWTLSEQDTIFLRVNRISPE